jgi:hypothetical protein
VRIALALVPALLLTACPPSGPECGDGSSCLTGEVCANTHECLPSDQVHAVTVHWTIDGQPASAALCTRGNLTLTIRSLSTGAELGYSPVPCANGFFGFDKLPTYYDTVDLEFLDTGGVRSGSIPAAGGDVFIDLPP